MSGPAPRTPLPLLLLLVGCCGLAAELELSAVPSTLAVVGSDALLGCTFTVRSLRIDLRYLGILWRFQGRDLLLVYNRTLEVLHPRVSINVSEIPTGTASLMLANVTTSDEGDYTCSVTYTPNKEQKTVTLHIQAQPEIIVLEQVVTRGKENLLRCSVVGFYPLQIDAFWLRDGTPLPGSSMSKPVRNPNGTYTINTTVPVTPTDGDASLNISCAVSHESLPRTLQKQLPLSIAEDTVQTGVIVTAVVVPLAVVGLAAVLGWCWHWRTTTHVEMTLCDIQGPDTWILGETTKLVCVGHHCPKNTRTEWVKCCRDTEAETVVGASSVHQDMLPLLDRDHYRAKFSKTPQGGGSYTVTSTLRIRARLEEDEGAVFKCRVFAKNQTNVEKEFKDFRVCGKPEVEGILCCPCDGNRVRCTLNMTKVYPKEIQIIWFIGGGKLQETPSGDHVTRHSDQVTFDISSECVVPEECFADQHFKIIVTWNHVSQRAPQYREMSVTSSEFPGRPTLEDIAVPLLFKGKEACLSCRVSGYFPSEIQVTWLKMPRGSDEPVPISDGNGSCQLTEHLFEEGVGYSCTAVLAFSPDQNTEPGSEFICQVSHPSLQEPLRKHTPKLNSMSKCVVM